MRFRVMLACVLLICAIEATASPPDAPTSQQLSLAEAVSLAQQRHPAAREAAARVQAASARLRSAAPENPLLAIAHGFGKDTGGMDEDILVTQTIELGTKRRHRVAAARADRDSALVESNGSSLDITLAVKSAYYEALRAQAEQQLASDALATARKFAEAAQTQFDAGQVARSHIVRTTIELSRTEQDLAAAETERANRFADLASLVGIPADTTVVLTDKLEFTSTAYQIADLQALAAKNRPDLLAAQLQCDSLASSLRGVIAESQPDLVLEGRRGSIEPDIPGSSIRVGVTLPLFDLGRHHADVDAARAALAGQQAALDEVTRTARLEVETALRNLDQKRDVVLSFQKGRLNNAKELLQMAETGYDKGATSYLEMLDAQQVYRSEQTDYAQALADYSIALAALDRAVGGRLK